MIEVGIVGASGYGGLELMRWLAHHPGAKVLAAQSASGAGKAVSEVFPSLSGAIELPFTEPDPAALRGLDVIFLAVDNGHAACLAEEILAQGSKVVDLSADHRFREARNYEAWYTPHPRPEQTHRAVYGLPELHASEIGKSDLIGNPGCYATATILALAPLVADGAIDLASIVVDGKSGVSGAGRSNNSLAYHYAEANESVSAYKVAGTHRHTGEIEQELSAAGGEAITISFTPHLIPMTRGILASCYAKLAKKVDLSALFAEFYRDQPFVKVCASPPTTKQTLASNRCDLFPTLDGRTGRVSVFSAIDNLGKGMAGQAIQNMNLMFGLDQTTGLVGGALWP